jgi:predicted MPP superfamily phosphohydrolase
MHFPWNIFFVFLLIQILGFLIWWRRIGKRTRIRLLLISLFLAGNLPWPFLFTAFSRQDPPSSWFISLIFRFFVTWQAGVILWLLLVGIISLAVLIFLRLPSLAARRLRSKPVEDKPADPDRRSFMVRAARGTVWGAVLGSGAWGFAWSEATPKVIRYNISPAGLPQILDGLTIAHLSDLHIGIWTSPHVVPRVMALTRDLKPDLVVITGDIIEHRPYFSKVLVQHLHLLDKVPLGIYATIGNHDIYTGADQVSKALESGGITMLRNRNHSFNHEGLPLALVGVDDPGRNFLGKGGDINLGRAMYGIRPDQFPILLTHRPTGFEQARKRNISLTLCGHTHGGQIGLPGILNLADLAYDYTHGLYEKKGYLLHVTAGIGTVGLPIRVGVPPEVALLRLSAPPGKKK